MGRKSKLTEAQWAEIERRLLEGEPRRALAREFGIAESSIRERLSAQVKETKSVANQIVNTEQRLSALPISAQINAQNLASKLRAISGHLASAAEYGASTAHRLSAIAASEVEKIDDVEPGRSAETLRGVAALTALANESSKIAINLLSANKDQVNRLNEPEEQGVKTLSQFYGEIATKPESRTP
jgi:hypothetical protein